MATASEIAVARAPAQLIDTALARAREYKRVRTIVRAHPAGRSQSGPAARSRMTGAVEGMPVGGASAHLKLGLQPGPGVGAACVESGSVRNQEQRWGYHHTIMGPCQ